MKRSMLSAACLLITLLVVGSAVSKAEAQGCVNYGSPNRYYGNYGGYYGSYNGGYGVYPGYGVVPYSTNYRGGWGGNAQWHDTTHLDYHPGEVVRHRNHYHYVPGHYDVHEEGHWDHHGF